MASPTINGDILGFLQNGADVPAGRVKDADVPYTYI